VIRRFALALWLVFLAVPPVHAEDVRRELVGRWVGESICTGVRKACHDEVASYRISLSQSDPAAVTMSLNKMVGDEEAVMGVMDFAVDAASKSLIAEARHRDLHMVWKFQWDGPSMRGTLTEPPGGPVIRNIRLHKE
jgi:hypothetical protein